MRGRRLGIGAAFAVLAGLLHAGGSAQGPNNRAQETVINAIKAEGLRSSEAPVLFHTLTDVFGARLTGRRVIWRPRVGPLGRSAGWAFKIQNLSRLECAGCGASERGERTHGHYPGPAAPRRAS